MLPIRLVSKNIRTQIKLPYQWLSFQFNTIRLSSNSSSDSSDSSDSDTDIQNKKKQQIKESTKNVQGTREVDNNDDLNKLMDSLINNKPSSTVDIKLKLKDRKHKLEKQVLKAASLLTTAVGGDRDQIVSTLLQGLSKIEKESSSSNAKEGSSNIPKEGSSNNVKETQSNIKNKRQPFYTKGADNFWFIKERSKNIQELIDQVESQNKQKKSLRNHKQQYTRKLSDTYRSSDEYRVTKMYANDYKTTEMRNVEMQNKQKVETKQTQQNQSVTATLLNKHKSAEKHHSFSIKRGKFNFPLLFQKTNIPSPSNCELETWDACQAYEIKVLGTLYPENAFQEMIQWTEEGKIWKFPIDNEQGMEEEQNVHFSEHVFLERHVTDWCPAKGPIRHFMELVCIGLSKNPYMTAQEKYEHIMWYKNYFEDKNDLLEKLGIGKIVSSTTEMQIEAK
ncbi:28S ribosomal protein S31, mitochondrial isoform X1 [Hylaeus anthracinus]|uniref:28S ribosomal protein S31, mitochondrial isoform X1 n=1 Tax=Hylaeus anthracinus TaxID=313031 RepID=UPI0023B9D1E1|nr:28S ribosomal protein S31, mitochondrial isoform X1 [Hylaeus anthracinus]